MASGIWRQWAKKPEVEGTLVKRAHGNLPEMESTKQLVKLISEFYQPGMKVLDVGCNVGHYLRGLRRIDAVLDYTGVDATAFYIEQASDIFKDDPHANFEVRDILEPLFPDDSFDIVYCCNVILHLPDFRVPVRNLLASTKKVCLIRTLLADKSTVAMAAETQDFDDNGMPREFVYQNTWQCDYFAGYINSLGWQVEFIEDEFNPDILSQEHQDLKKGEGTRIFGGQQISGNVVFNWKWAKITPA